MKVVGTLMVRRDRPSFVNFFPQYLDRMQKLVDHLYVRIDKTGDDVVSFLEPLGDWVHWDWQYDHPNDNHLEDQERQALLDWALTTDAEWCFAFDSDEVLEEGAAEALRTFVDRDPPYRILLFPLTYCSHHRCHKGYVLRHEDADDGRGVSAGRGFRLSDPEIRHFRYEGDDDGLHCGTLPSQSKNAAVLKEIVTIHHHACSPEEYQHKKNFYAGTSHVDVHGGIDWLYREDRFGKEENARPYSEAVVNRQARFEALMRRVP